MNHAIVALIVYVAFGVTANDIPGRLVFIKDSEIFTVNLDGSGMRQLTADQSPKQLPKWSPDGESIVYISRPSHDPDAAFVRIKILSKDGLPVKDFAFRPRSYGRWTGMRYVERVEWDTDNVILISGSLDPSTCEYVLLDPLSGKEEGDYFCDGFSLSVSPNGKHVACLGQIPHFSQADGRDEYLQVDRDRVFPTQRAQIKILSPRPVWSDESDAVFVLAQAEGRKQAMVWRIGSGPRLAPWPNQITANANAAWIGDKLHIFDSGNAVYQLNDETQMFLAVDAASAALLQDNRPRIVDMGKVEMTARKLGGGDTDVWPRGKLKMK